MPQHIAPMLVTPAKPFSGPGWLFEAKWDGIRCLAYIDAGQLRLVSRRQRNMTSQFPELSSLPSVVAAERAILDGELVALNADGLPDFDLLMQRIRVTRSDRIRQTQHDAPVTYVVFDLLYADDRDLRSMPLIQRKTLLRQLLQLHDHVAYSDHVIADGELFFHAVMQRGIEGVVAKKMTSPYRTHSRSAAWLKWKIPGWHREFGFQHKDQLSD